MKRRTGTLPLPRGKAREKLRQTGQFWTPDWIADAMVAYVLGNGANETFDPAVGAGSFFRAALRICPDVRLRGSELDAAALDLAIESGLRTTDLRGVEKRDFVLDPPSGHVPAIVANPPYIRHHRLSVLTKARLRAFCREFLGAPIDGRAGYHVYFLLRALQLLTPGGRLAFIVPADVCEGVFASGMWRVLADRFRIDAVVTFAPKAAPFPEVDTNAIILFIANETPRSRYVWALWTEGDSDALFRWIGSGFVEKDESCLVIERTLTEGLATGLSRAPAPGGQSQNTLGDYARVMRGIATGANDFFFLTAAQVAELRLPQCYLRRAVGRTRDVTDLEFTPSDLERLDAAGRPTYLLALNGGPLPAAAKRYIEAGEARGIHQRALIATRRPWYKMETRVPPPILFAYLGRRGVRFVRNRTDMVPLTGFLCVYPRPEYDVEAVWRVLSHPETQANLRLVGKSYGDGAIKVEPRALERLPLPDAVVAVAGLTPLNERRQGRLAFDLRG